MGIALAGGLLGAPSAQATPSAPVSPTSTATTNDVALKAKPKFQMPFTCNQKWYTEASTSDHSSALDMWLGDGNTNKPGTAGQWVRASAAGKVVQSYNDPSGAGNIIQIKHSGNWFTTYIHLKKRSVKKGTKVPMGKKIGTVGRTGETSGGVNHLHYEQACSKGSTASWGEVGSQRRAVHFNGKKYTGVGNHWQITSRNTGAQDSCGT